MNNHFWKRLTALATAAALTLSFTVTGAGAIGTGNQLHTSYITISDSLAFVNTVSEHSVGRIESYAFEYKPQGDVSVVAYSGDKLWGSDTIQQAADALTAQGYYVLGGVNADFFSFSNGVPMGLVIRDGELISSNDGRSGVAFREDGTAFVTTPTLTFTLSNQGGGDPATGLGQAVGSHAGQTVEVHHYNKLRQSHYLYLLSSDFADTNKATSHGRDVIFRIVEGKVTVSGQVSLEVTDLREGSAATPLPEGHLVLTANAQSPYYDELTKFSIGDTVTLTVECDDEQLAKAVHAVGGGDVLVKGGSLVDPSHWDSALSVRNPRTAIGIRRNGSVLFYAVDGRQSAHSNGLSMTELAEELMGEGCIDVINLDGGGSTSLLLRSPTAEVDAPAVVNMPSDGTPRQCSTFLFLVSAAESDGKAKRLYFNQSGPVVLAGSTISLDGISARDNAYRPAETPSAITYFLNGQGSFDPEQFRYTAGKTPGVDTIQAASDNGAKGSTTITVVNDVTSIALTRRDTGEACTALYPEAGEVIELAPVANVLFRNALSDPSVFTYRTVGNIGTVSRDGVYTAGSQRGADGVITISYGTHSAVIPVIVGENVKLLEDFENLITLFTNEDPAMTVTDQRDYVRLGHRAGVLSYDFNPSQETAAEELPTEEPLEEPTPGEGTSAEEIPAGAPSAEGTPAETVPVDGASTEAPPAEEAPAGSAPAEEGTSEDTPAETVPSENVPAQGTPAEEPSGQAASTGDAPAADEKSSDAQAADRQPAVTSIDYIFTVPVSFDRAPNRLALWVYGDSSGLVLSALLQDADGVEHTVPFGAVDFTGYAQLVADIRLTGACQFTGLRLSIPSEEPAAEQPPAENDTADVPSTEESSAEEVPAEELTSEPQVEKAPPKLPEQGKLYVDQLVAPGGADPADAAPPAITLSYENGLLTAALSDDSWMTFHDTAVSLAVDGADAAFTLKDNILTAPLALNDGSAHRITVSAGDVFGNLARASLDLPAAEPASSFSDVAADHWASPYIEFLFGRGVINGVGDGKFSPGGPMTREAFCTMLSRYLALDTAQYADTEVPFTDTESISSWALDHVKAMYTLGYVGGRSNGDGTVRFAPSAPITRGEIFTLLGRLAGKGYESGFQTRFTDQDSIPAWAWDGVCTTVSMGLVGGYGDNTIRTGNSATRAEVAKILYFLY